MCEGARARREVRVRVRGAFCLRPLRRGPSTEGLKAAVVPSKQDTVVSDSVGTGGSEGRLECLIFLSAVESTHTQSEGRRERE